MLNTRHTKSEEVNPEGAISTKQVQTPTAQNKLMSLDDFRWMIRTISGIFHNGRITAAIRAIF